MSVASTNINTGNSRSLVVQWSAIGTDDVGDALPFSQYTDKSVQVTGTFGGASVRLQGSNDGTNWFTLTDPQGNPLSFSAAGLEAVSEATRFVRPSVVGGVGAAINVHLLCKE
jgi:hypothetical protein